MLDAAAAEVAEKRIPGAQRQESKRWNPIANGLRKQTVHDFVGGPVTPDSDEVPLAMLVSIAGDLGRVSGRAGSSDRYVKTGITKTLQRGTEEFPSPSAAGCRIRDR